MNFTEVLENHIIFKKIAETAEELNTETYVIGGFVRDLLLKRNSKDIDFVCKGSGIALAEACAHKISPNLKVNTFKNFGTAMFRYEDWDIEFVGARKESYRQDSRKPIIEDGTLEDDQLRRDFTINALAISINKNNYGALIDPFEGIKDLKRKLIRTPLDANITFSDDPLRMMRAIRFASQLNFDIEPDTFEAITINKNRIQIVSPERITDELNKIILSPKPSYGFKLLFQSGILQLIFPELVALHGVEAIDNKSHKDNFYHTLQVLDNVSEQSTDLWLRWAALLHDIAKPMTKRFDPKVGFTFHGHEDKGARMVAGIFRRMKLPLNEKMKSVENLVKLHLRPIPLVKKEITDSAIRRLIVDAGADYENLMLLCKADVTSKNNDKVKRYLENFKEVERKVEIVLSQDDLRNFQPVLTGEHIMQIFDLPPSKIIGEIKTALREELLEGNIPNEYNSCLEFVKHFTYNQFHLSPKQ
ncbi:MAG: HD domain-containing protein [Cytophagales bacterium]|nr:MAG: HD domain-containing protein [Cytophagales bacterium]